MATFVQRVYGQIAVRLGYVTTVQVEAALKAQAAQPDPQPLGVLLVQEGELSSEQAAAVLRRQRAVLEDAATAGGAAVAGRRFGQIAVARKLAGVEAVGHALEVQARRAAAGITQNLGEILLESGTLSLDAVVEVLEAQAQTEAPAPPPPPAEPGSPAPPPPHGPTGPLHDTTHGAPPPPPPPAARWQDTIREAPGPARPPARPGTSPPEADRTVALGAEGSSAVRPETTPTVRRVAWGAETVEPLDTAPPGPDAAGSAPAAAGSRRLGKYELVRELGRGGMGVVYKAYHPGLKSYFAVKVLLAGSDASVEEIRRFHREAEAAARLKHPGIVAVHDIGEEDGKTYFAMEYVEGQSLDQVLDDPHAAGIAPAPIPRSASRSAQTAKPGGRQRAWGLNAPVAAQMTRDVAEVLQAAHDVGVVHRDLKPANVLRDRAGRLKVMDFGLARLVDTEGKAGATRSGAVMGTPAYMSPEQAEGRVREVDAKSDVYQLGAILYELLTGRPPYDGETTMDILLKVMQEDPIPPRRLNPGIDRDVETICLKCLERDRGRRYATAADLAADLGRFLAGDPIEARPISGAARLARRMVKYRRILVPLAAAALVAVGLGVYGVVQKGVAMAHAEGRRQAEVAEARAVRRQRAEQILGRAEGLWRDAKGILYRPTIPLERYHEKLEEARKTFDEAIEQDPDYGWIYESRGRVKIQTNDLDGAEEDLKKALALLGPEHGKVARRSLGRVYLERSFDFAYSIERERALKGQKGAESRRLAIAELQASAGRIEWRGTAEEGENAEHLARGFEALAASKFEDAERIFRLGVDQRFDEECAWGLASISKRDAEKWLAKALEIRPRYARALVDRVSVWEDKGDLARALADYDLALQINPRHALTHNNRGVLRARLGDFAGALADYDEAIRLDPRDGVTFSNRGFARAKTGDFAGAIADCDAALKLDSQGDEVYNNRGFARAGKGDRAGALADYEAAIKLNPQYAQAYNNRGAVRAEAGDFAGAIADFDTALKLDPQHPQALGNRGSARTDQGDLAGALVDFEAAVKLTPRDPQAYLDRGRARRKVGDLAGALTDCDEALRLDPQAAKAWFERGITRAEKGDLAGAIADYDAAIRIQPGFADAWHNRGCARKDQGDLAGALADYEATLKLDPRHALAFYNRASVREATDDLAGAISDYSEALRIDPGNAAAYNCRGLAHAKQGDLPAARADYDAALKIDSRQIHAYNNRGLARAAQGDRAGAIADYDAALRIDPRFAAAYDNRGLARAAQGDLAGAIADYDAALACDPRDPGAYNNRGNARKRKGDLAGALADFGEALRLDPRFTNAYSNRGLLRVRMGDLAGAIADYDEALRIDPRFAAAWFNRGLAHVAQGDRAAAIADFDAALKIDPGDAESYANRGNVRAESDDLAGALADYDRALQIDPQYVDAYANRGDARKAKGDRAGAAADYAKALEIAPSDWEHRQAVQDRLRAVSDK